MDSTKPRYSNPDRTKPATQDNTERHSKASNETQSGTKQHERNKIAQKFGTKQSRIDHREQPRGIQAQIERVLLWRDGGVWRETSWRVGIVRRDRGIYVYMYIYIYMYIYTIAGDFLQSLTRTPAHNPGFFSKFQRLQIVTIW